MGNNKPHVKHDANTVDDLARREIEVSLELAKIRCAREGHHNYEALLEFGKPWPVALLCRCGAQARVTEVAP